MLLVCSFMRSVRAACSESDKKLKGCGIGFVWRTSVP